MQSIQAYYHKGYIIEVTETHDIQYARDCFEGSDREWADVLTEARGDTFYIVSSGLQGGYMRDNVSVLADKESALLSAKDQFEDWKDQDAEDAEETDEDAS